MLFYLLIIFEMLSRVQSLSIAHDLPFFRTDVDLDWKRTPQQNQIEDERNRQ